MYCSREDIEALFGAANVARWADLDNDGDPAKIEARINAAITTAYAEVNRCLRGGVYVIPWLGTPPVTLTQAAAALAGAWLHLPRSGEDGDNETGPQAVRRRALATLGRVRVGVERLEVAPAGLVPRVVKE